MLEKTLFERYRVIVMMIQLLAVAEVVVVVVVVVEQLPAYLAPILKLYQKPNMFVRKSLGAIGNFHSPNLI
jgi:hypothetical protein